jgi:hypothetical protein
LDTISANASDEAGNIDLARKTLMLMTQLAQRNAPLLQGQALGIRETRDERDATDADMHQQGGLLFREAADGKIAINQSMRQERPSAYGQALDAALKKDAGESGAAHELGDPLAMRYISIIHSLTFH